MVGLRGAVFYATSSLVFRRQLAQACARGAPTHCCKFASDGGANEQGRYPAARPAHHAAIDKPKVAQVRAAVGQKLSHDPSVQMSQGDAVAIAANGDHNSATASGVAQVKNAIARHRYGPAPMMRERDVGQRWEEELGLPKRHSAQAGVIFPTHVATKRR